MNNLSKNTSKYKKQGSLRRKLTMRILILVVSVCVLSAIVSGSFLYQTANNDMISSTKTLATAEAVASSKAVGVFKLSIRAAAQDSLITSSTAPDIVKTSRRKELAEKFNFKEIVTADQNGRSTTNADVKDREYFQKAMQGQTFFTSTMVRKTDNSIVMHVATKIDNGTNYNGIIYGILPSDTFCGIVDDVTIGKTGYAFIVDKTGNIIAHKDREKVTNFTNYITMAEKDKTYNGLASLIKNMISLSAGTQTVELNGQKLLVSYQPIEDTDGWSIGVVAPVNEMMAGFYQALVVMIILTLLFVLLGIIIAFRISNAIAKPINAIVERVKGLAAGDLHAEVPVTNTNDEIEVLSTEFSTTVQQLNAYIGELRDVLKSISDGDLTAVTKQDYRGDFVAIKQSLDEILDSLNSIFAHVDVSAQQVASGADQVSSGAQALSQGATEQASSIEELSATITEIATMVKENAATAEDANTRSQASAVEVEKGNETMSQMIQAMEDINQTSSEIGKIIKTIQDIAFQTNILALNAAVEAARAGEAGKGFSVVADEVRNLAGKSAEAAKNTTILIENAVRSVQQGQEIANATAQSLQSIVQSTYETTGLISQISASSNEQASAIEQITQGVDQIAAVVQTNSATSEESAATSEELNSQAQLLRQTLETLNLRKDAPQGTEVGDFEQDEFNADDTAELTGFDTDKY